MVYVTVDCSESLIEGLSIPEFRSLRHVLSYTIPSNIPTIYPPVTKYLLDAKGRFPTGLLYLVETYLSTNKISNHITYQNLSKRPKRPSKPLFKASLGVTPYPEQIEASKACSASNRGIVSAVTGSGKSLIAALIINELQVPTLVVVPNLELKRQLTKTLSDIFGHSMVGGHKAQKPIAVENIAALPLKKDGYYKALILDEFHHSGATTYQKLNKKAWTDIFYRFGLTATPFRSQDHERLLLEGVISEVIYELGYHKAVEKGYITPVEAYYFEVPKQKVKGTRWASVYSEIVVNNKIRNDQLQQILVKLHVNKLSTLCLVKEIQHGEILSSDGAIPLVTGQNEERHLIDLFNSGKIPVLIGTTGVMGEGIDTKPCEYVIIAGLGKSKNQFMQQVGRGLRRYPGKTSCKIILIKDTSHKWSLNHFKEQCKILAEEYSVIPEKIIVD